MSEAALQPASPRFRFTAYGLLLAASVLLFILLRLRWSGHLLMWDEAMNLLSIRAFAAGGHDGYSSWFWRYPPLYNLLIVLVQPLTEGFITRAEWMTLFVQVCGLLALAAVNRRAYGPIVALASCFALAVMPGSIFYGLWIKQDHLSATTGLLALWLCGKQRWGLTGLALGVALLSKQFAAFYAIAIALELTRERKWMPLVIVAAISALASLWWYVLFSTSGQLFLQFATTGTAAASDLWIRPWHYYGGVLWRDAGPLGLALAAAGLFALATRRHASLWPGTLFLPALLVLSLSPGKTPWYLLTFYPAVASLQGLAADRIWAWIRPRLATRRIPATGLAVGAAALIAFPVFRHDYDKHMQAREFGMWDASYTSREAAEALNIRVREGENVLVSTMYYYGESIQSPCPIFVIYLKDMPVLVRPFGYLTASNMVDTVRGYDIDWAMLSPRPGEQADALIQQLYRDHGLRPKPFRGVLIYRTSSLRTAKPAAAAAPTPAPPAH